MTDPLYVSDHAVLRWLERVEGVNCKAIRRRIEVAARVGQKHGARSVRKDGVTFLLQYDDDKAVVATCHSPQLREHLAEPRLSVDDMEEDPQ